MPKEQVKKLRKTIPLKIKCDILEKQKSGASAGELARKFNIPRSTVWTIVKNRDRYLEQDREAGTLLARKKQGLIFEVEKVLLAWMNDEGRTTPLNKALICAKALSIFEDIKNQRGGKTRGEMFKASKQWFYGFCQRAGWSSAASTSLMVTESSVSNSLLDKSDENGEESLEVIKQAELQMKGKLLEAFNHIEQALMILEEHDPCATRSSRVAAAIRKDYACYREIYFENLGTGSANKQAESNETLGRNQN